MRRELLIKEREDRNLSRVDVAKILGIAEITVRSIENKRRDPSSKTATKFAFLYNTRVDVLFPDIFLPKDDTKRIIKSKLKNIERKEATT